MNEAIYLKENATDLDKAVVEVEGYIERLEQIAVEVSTEWGQGEATWRDSSRGEHV